MQAQEHLALARELLPFTSSCKEEKLEVLMCLLSIHLIQGGAMLITAEYPFPDMFNISVWVCRNSNVEMKISLTFFNSCGGRILFSRG